MTLISACLRNVHTRFAGHHAGAVADYIPELSGADPNRFAIVLATADGAVYAVGDDDVEFTIQSISKPFVYGMALGDHGVESVTDRIGVEPSGDAFNSIVMDERHNRPMNPMVNAGAIAAAALVDGPDATARIDRVLATFGRYAGRSLRIDEKVFESERSTGHRNRAIAFLELSSGMIDEPVDDHLELYFAQCSILVTARDLAMMGATLANAGVNPVTGERAISVSDATRVLSVMATCGMYDGSGQWMYRVGLPAKSGVGGGILVVLPGQLAIATFSPPLDEFGNSARGVLACEALATELSLHLLHPVADVASVLRRRYTAAEVSSKRVRGPGERSRLQEFGDQVEVFELQGDLSFARTERFLREVEPVLDEALEVIIDLHRVSRLDPTSASLFGQLLAKALRMSVTLTVSGAIPEVQRALEDQGWRALAFTDDVDAALERAEDVLLGVLPDALGSQRGVPVGLAAIDILRSLPRSELAALEAEVSVRAYEAGEHIIRVGELADRLFFLGAGRAAVVLPLEGEGRVRRLRTFAAGVTFGESALFDGARRTADVIADGPVICYELSLVQFEALAERSPRLHAAILRGVGRNLAGQLSRSMQEIRALDQ